MSLTAERPALAPLGDPPAMAAANQSLRVVSMDTAQTETPLPTEEEYLQDMIRVWRGRKNRRAASRDACAGAVQQQTAARSEHAQGGCAPCASSKRAKQLHVGRVKLPVWDQNVLVCALKSVDAAEKLLRDIMLPVGGLQLPFRGHHKLSGEFCRSVVTVSQDEMSESVKRKLSAEPNVVSVRKLGGTSVVVLTFVGTRVPRTVSVAVPACPLCGTVGHRTDACPRPQAGRCGSCGVQVPDATPDGPAEHQCAPSCLLCGGGHPTGAPGCAGRLRKPIKPGSPPGSKPKTRHKQVPTPKGGPKKAPAAQPEPKKAQTGSPTNVKSGTQARPPVLKAKDFPPLAPVEPQQQVEELRRQNQVLARKIHELEAKQVGPSETTQEAELDDGDDGSSVKSCLSSVSRQTADTVVQFPLPVTSAASRPWSAQPSNWRIRESFLEMFTAALRQTLPEIVAQVSDSVLNAMQPWVSSQIKNATRCDSPVLKRKTASRQAAEESGSGPALGGPVQPLIGTASAPGPSRGFRAWKKRSHLQLYLQSLGDMPALLALQEPGMDDKFSGYSTFQGGPSTCILVNKAYTAVQVDLDLSTAQEYTMVRVLPLRRRDPLIDPSQTRGETQKQLRRALQGYQGTTAQLADSLCDRYLCRTEDPSGPECTYSGKLNQQLDAPFELHDLKAALAKMRRGTAPGRDRITRQALLRIEGEEYGPYTMGTRGTGPLP
ncbi:hypothetical protein HPB49_015341 [Dermacentor silvarum]|uniref:Uncharacterized protein n=1 Tax=Dermacentor silvarum TaxID=543639 RepID=A0ACB8CRQ3_DERSI|nr:hypothetical protein HPB49_015341 [Dermacentor silvarum]